MTLPTEPLEKRPPMTDRNEWDSCDGSCECHNGICRDCGCTNDLLAHERSAGAATIDVAPEALADAIVLADEEWGEFGSYVERAETILACLSEAAE